MMKKVIIIGGGVAGMSAAHELIERGFDVEVYEKQHQYVGGKARSVDVPGTNTQHPDKYLPGEHGFRFFPGFYTHVVDTMKRTPVDVKNYKPGDPTCFDNLEDTKTIMITRKDKPTIVFPTDFFGSIANIKMLYKLYKNRNKYMDLRPGESNLFKSKMLQLMGSCNDRRESEYEKLSWSDYLEAEGKSKDYVDLFVVGVTRTLVAADAHKASTKTDGNIILQLVYNFVNPTIRTDRLFNAPTNDAWLNPWYNYLVANGVKYNKASSLHKINMSDDGKIASVEINDRINKTRKTVTGDYYILAVPADRAAEHVTKEMIAAEPAFAKLPNIVENMSWMTGMQFYLNQKVDINDGHVNYASTPWALTSVDQIKFWNNYDLSDRFNGKVKSILSVDISNWVDADKDIHLGPADKDDLEKIKEGVWHQLMETINKDKEKPVLEPDMLEHYYLDHDINFYPKGDFNTERMLVNTINSWEDRPEATTKIPNLFLASDYVKTYTDLATMEAANEAARRAVNGIIDASGLPLEKCKIWPLKEPALFNPIKWFDKKRFKKNLPYPEKLPFWLKLVMIIWGLLYVTYFTFRVLLFKLLGLKPK